MPLIVPFTVPSEVGTEPPPSATRAGGNITDRLRFTIIEVNTNRIITRDLVVQEPEVMWRLSAPAIVSFKVLPGEALKSGQGIVWKNFGYWIITEMEINYQRRIICATIVNNNKLDAESGVIQIESEGFMGYPAKIPFLVNLNPIAIDPFEVVQRMWAHCQNYSNANLEVEVYPASSGTQMLPGYSFDGSVLSFDFFAMFLRAVDFPDCGDIIEGLARDIPFDMVEEATWDIDRTTVTKKLHLLYPYGGLHQDHLSFLLGENVISAEKAEELDIEPVSDVIIRSWAPGKVIVSQLSNYDPTRLRKVMIEDDAKIDSQERAAAWAGRKLQRRNVPVHFEKITIDANHPHAPAGSFDVGDSIYVEAPDFPWFGTIKDWHRITSIMYKEAEGMMELGLKVEGAFNYDPIDYNPDYAEQPTEDPNRVYNGYFQQHLGGWRSIRGQWFRVPTEVYETYLAKAGSVRCDLDDEGEALRSNRIPVTPGEHLHVECRVKWEEVDPEVPAPDVPAEFQLVGITSMDADETFGEELIFDTYVNPTGAHGWHTLEALDWTVPDGINEVALQFTVTPGIAVGKSWWTYARLVPVGTPEPLGPQLPGWYQ